MPIFRSFPFVAAATVVAWLTACHREPRLPPLKPSRLLDASQVESLRKMNEAGRVPFAGWTWSYEFGADCVLRVRRTYDGAEQSPEDHPVYGYSIETVPYTTAGFGVKGWASDGSGGIDLFDARREADAKDFAEQVARLIAKCPASQRAHWPRQVMRRRRNDGSAPTAPH